MAHVEAMRAAMRRLDGAYVAYRHRLERQPDDLDDAAKALDIEIDEVKSDAPWRRRA